MKRWSSIAGIAAAVLLVLAAAKNVIAKTVVESGARLITGLRLSMDGMDLGLLNTSIGIRGLKLHNPPGFADPLMANLPEIYVNYDPAALLSGGVHLEEVRLHLQEFTVERSAQGQLNLDSLNVVKESKRVRQGQPSAATKPKTRLRVDTLELHIGKVVYKDYTAGSTPRVQEFPVNIHERYENITNPYALGGLIVSRALMQTSIARLANFDIGSVQSLATSQLQHAQRLFGDAARQLKDPAALTGTAKATAEEIAGAGKEAVASATGALKRILPPLGDPKQDSRH